MLQDDPAYQLILRAKGYLGAAQLVLDSGNPDPDLRAPRAHLIAHGLEVLMKHVLVASGQSLFEVRRDFGHSLEALWQADGMEDLRNLAFESAEISWGNAENSGKYSDDFSQNPRELVSDYLAVLDRLHTSKSEYALRYFSDPNETAPRPAFLLDTFQPVADRLHNRYLLSERARTYA